MKFLDRLTNKPEIDNLKGLVEQQSQDLNNANRIIRNATLEVRQLKEAKEQWISLSDSGDKRELDDAAREKIRQKCIEIYYKTPEGKAIIKNLTNYIIGNGVNWTAQDENPVVQEFINEFCSQPKVEFEKRQISIIKRTLRDGELFIHLLSDSKGKTYAMRFYSPGEITEIEKEEGDAETVVKYQRTWRDDKNKEQKQEIPADEIHHIRLEVDEDIDRGRPFLENVLTRIAQYEDWLDGRIKTNKAKSSIFLERIVEGSPSRVASVNAGFPGTSEGNFSEDEYAAQMPRYGTVVTHSKSVEWKWVEPKINADDCKEDGRQMRLSIAAGVQLPEFVLTSDSSNANYCHDTETEILTRRGWVSYGDMNDLDEFGTMNPQTQFLEFQKASKIHIYYYDGKMIKINGTHNLDMLITPNHRLYVSSHQYRRINGKLTTEGIKEFSFIEAGKLKKDKYLIKGAPNGFAGEYPNNFTLPGIKYEINIPDKKEREINMRDWVEFLGYFISEGWILNNGSKRWTIGLSQKDGESANKINNLIKRLPIKFQRHVSKKGIITWQIFDKALWFWLRDNVGAGAKNKKIPSFLDNLGPNLLRILLDALILGDGSVRKNGSKAYFTISPQLADQVQIIGLKLGYISILSHTMKNGVFPVILRNNLRKIAIKPFTHVKEIDYCGNVWCVTVPNGLIITRRNGKPAIHGNSSTTIAESPFVKGIEAHRLFFEYEFGSLFAKIIQKGIDGGLLPSTSTETMMKESARKRINRLKLCGGMDLKELNATFAKDDENFEERPVPTKTGVDFEWPSIITRNILEETQAVEMHRNMKICSRRTASMKLGYDPEEEDRIMEKESEEDGEEDAYAQMQGEIERLKAEMTKGATPPVP